MFAGCLHKGSEGEKKLTSECSDRLSTIQLDVTDTKQVQQAVERVQKTLGEKSKHLLAPFPFNVILRQCLREI